MASLNIVQASPFMNQEGILTKLTVVLPPGTQMEDVLPFIGKKSGIRLTNEPVDQNQAKDALLKDIRDKLERIGDFIKAEEGVQADLAVARAAEGAHL